MKRSDVYSPARSMSLISLTEYEEQNRNESCSAQDPSELFDIKVAQLAELLEISEERAERILLGKDPLPA